MKAKPSCNDAARLKCSVESVKEEGFVRLLRVGEEDDTVRLMLVVNDDKAARLLCSFEAEEEEGFVRLPRLGEEDDVRLRLMALGTGSCLGASLSMCVASRSS